MVNAQRVIYSHELPKKKLFSFLPLIDELTSIKESKSKR